MTNSTSGSVVPNRNKRFQVLIGAILVQLILGTVYGYSIFWEPLTANIFPPIVTEAQYLSLGAESVVTGTIIEIGRAHV